MKAVRGLVLFMAVCIMANIFIPMVSASSDFERAQESIRGTWYSEYNELLVVTDETINDVPYRIIDFSYTPNRRYYTIYYQIEGGEGYNFRMVSDGTYTLEIRKTKIRALEPDYVKKYTSYKK